MRGMMYDLPSIERLESKLDLIVAARITAQAWYSLREAWAVKGGCSYETFRTRRWYQPNGGRFDGRVGGKGVFSAATVREWLPLTDADLPEYHLQKLTGAKAPGRTIA
jgi:hypothetical protein